MEIIKINNLKKYYGKNRGVENLSLSVNEGDIYGFIGPNGAGKSTTIRVLMNFIFPTSGTAEIFGKDVTSHGEILRKSIGYLPSEVYYYDTIKVGELLNYSAKLKGVTDQKNIQRLVDAFELDLHKRFGQLSFGNKKKVGVIQALMHNPKLLILDEPTNGLDPLIQKTLLELLKEANSKGTTVFFSSHTLSVVQKMCNRIGIIKDGKMLDVDQSLKEKRLKRISIETVTSISKEALMCPGLDELVIQDNRADFYFNGQINDLFSRLYDMEIIDFNMQEPELEEVFLHFYERGGRS